MKIILDYNPKRNYISCIYHGYEICQIYGNFSLESISTKLAKILAYDPDKFDFELVDDFNKTFLG